jgi:hypothetical protein
MIYSRASKIAAPSFALLLAISLTGCKGRDYDIAEVDGVVLIKGKPGHKIRLEFIPDFEVAGPHSVAQTDTEGRFTLHLMERDGSAPAGAIVGQHKITLSDLQLAESPDGRGVPIRFGPAYGLSSSTPLKQEVKPGKQTVQIVVP